MHPKSWTVVVNWKHFILGAELAWLLVLAYLAIELLW